MQGCAPNLPIIATNNEAFSANQRIDHSIEAQNHPKLLHIR